ncbi:cytochrome P450 [Coniophora puteana RWD-64-598 SS2]|uniref:Cytochrome P450 n=1 Tax=Coniophora puteana (strain RWD-64-598) TaxID=741705 RepID=A0A5M3MLW5_CONPW|nr:cytochrome P450 [Coniophora puteana RWD-64-598 SS2]EIW79990.1 cytochrome P450 [Coniophora puteana RWD-64-598 SS2]
MADRAIISSVANVIFGPSFPPNTSVDLRILDKHLYSRVMTYLSLVDKSSTGVWPGRPLVKDFIDAVRSYDLSDEDRAAIFISSFWGFAAASANVTSWLIVFLLYHPTALAKVRNEVDSTMRERYHDDAFKLIEDPEAFGPSSFPIIESAVNETLRLTSNATPFRQATCDLNLVHGNTSVPIKDGDFLMANLRAQHFDPVVYPRPQDFIVDRFLASSQAEHTGVKPGTQPFFGFGAGKHACKGRLFAIRHIKAFVALLVYLVNIELDGGEQGLKIPSLNERSLNVAQMSRDIKIRTKRRHREDTR